MQNQHEAEEHTPGPWRACTAGSAKRGEQFTINEIYVYAPNTQDDTAICADIIDPVTQEPSEANANLIAAAPDLLEALIECIECEFAVTEKTAIAKAQAAIAKAKGQS